MPSCVSPQLQRGSVPRGGPGGKTLLLLLFVWYVCHGISDQHKKMAWGWLLAFIFDSLTTTQAEINLWFVPFVWAVCESCIEPIPTCSHGEILAVDFNNTNSCCPQYYCGKWKECVWLSVSPSSMSCVQHLPCVAVCDVNLCPESSVSCAPGLTLVQTTQPGSCCPQHHCGTHSHAFVQSHTIKAHSVAYLFLFYVEMTIEITRVFAKSVMYFA